MLTINVISIIIIFLISIALGYWSYVSSVCYDSEKDEKKHFKNAPWQWRFFEVWNFFISFFLGGLMGYYFVMFRFVAISKGDSLNLADFVLFFIFATCILRWFPYLVKNLTVGISEIALRIVKKLI